MLNSKKRKIATQNVKFKEERGQRNHFHQGPLTNSEQGRGTIESSKSYDLVQMSFTSKVKDSQKLGLSADEGCNDNS